ncbi:TPA: hypothetical protein JBF02_15920, partial [Legionella pneumophila]|nr:hypothetical protein [Legionella pneumophila]
LVNEPAIKRWIDENSKKAISLDAIYFSFQERKEAYQAICQEVINIVTKNQNTCFIIYGHPLILSNSAEQLIKEIKEESLDLEIEILPGISSIDTLLCDLCIDPGNGGLQAFEATEFINTNHKINTNSHLILWQIGVVGVKSIIQNDKDLVDSIERKIAIFQLQRKLLDWYNETHPIVLYVASIYPQVPCEKFDICLSNLDKVNIPRLATAYIKPDLIP